MCTNPIPIKCPPSAMDLYKGISSQRELLVPCGKCAECLAKRQNDLMIRVYEEAKSKGCACFVTLTYAPEHEPISQSLWSIDKQTGEYERIFEPIIVEDSSTLDIVRGYFVGKIGVRIYEESLSVPDTESEYVLRYTPSLYYYDVQLALKRFRKNNPGLPSFSYCFVGEYGSNPNSTHRPHYHCIFFGLQWKDVYKFTKEWKYGFTQCKQVSFINSDKSDGLAKVARYVGKYCSKGKFDSCAKRDGLTLSSRLCSSKGLGVRDVEKMRRWYLALDSFDYNPDDISKLPSDMLNRIVERIVLRLKYDFNGFHYSLPISFKNAIFCRRIVKNHSALPKQFREKCFGLQDKAVFSPIYYAVADFIRNQLLQRDAEAIEKYKVQYASEGLSFALDKFEADRTDALCNREKNKESSILRFYQYHSKI